MIAGINAGDGLGGGQDGHPGSWPAALHQGRSLVKGATLALIRAPGDPTACRRQGHIRSQACQDRSTHHGPCSIRYRPCRILPGTAGGRTRRASCYRRTGTGTGSGFAGTRHWADTSRRRRSSRRTRRSHPPHRSCQRSPARRRTPAPGTAPARYRHHTCPCRHRPRRSRRPGRRLHGHSSSHRPRTFHRPRRWCRQGRRWWCRRRRRQPGRPARVRHRHPPAGRSLPRTARWPGHRSGRRRRWVSRDTVHSRPRHRNCSGPYRTPRHTSGHGIPGYRWEGSASSCACASCAGGPRRACGVSSAACAGPRPRRPQDRAGPPGRRPLAARPGTPAGDDGNHLWPALA